MELRFLGSGAAEGIPALFCRCGLCREAREKQVWFTRSQLLVDGVMLIDFPPDSYYRAVKQGVDLADVKSILITHSHSDHFYPEDLFMRGLASSYGVDSPLTVYGSKKVAALLKDVAGAIPKGEYRHLPKDFCGLTVYPQSVEYAVVNAYDVFNADGYKVAALPSEHMPAEPSYVYAVSKRNKSFLYCTDTAPLSDGVFEFLKESRYKFGCIIYDGTYGKLDYNEGHMNFADCDNMRGKLTEFGLLAPDCSHIITHVSHNAASSLNGLKCSVPSGFVVAQDGCTVNI